LIQFISLHGTLLRQPDAKEECITANCEQYAGKKDGITNFLVTIFETDASVHRQILLIFIMEDISYKYQNYHYSEEMLTNIMLNFSIICHPFVLAAKTNG
jgi:hypothetical protein